jgi:SWI/SNF-related matrix-associated actin-dependent regulator 1 of chromatin subfamily A
MPNRPRDLFNILRCIGHPSARSFISFARRYCDAYRNDFGWVTDGASNLDELNLMLKELMLRRRKEEVLDLPSKIRSWVPVEIDSPAALTAQAAFVAWFLASDPSRPNDKDFLARLTKVRVALHKAKHAAITERIKDVLATGQKAVVFTCFTEGLQRHRKAFGSAAVSISGSDSAEERLEAVDRFQGDPEIRLAVCNLQAGGVGLTLTAATHIIFQDLDWAPANHIQAEDRAYRIGQHWAVTVEYMLAAGTLDAYIAELLELKVALIRAVEADEVPEESILAALQQKLREMGPALLIEGWAQRAGGAAAGRIEAVGKEIIKLFPVPPIAESGVHEFRSTRDPSLVYRVTFGRGGHLECTCEGFRWRGQCKHVREVRQQSFGEA